jgi:hypothetical protein
MTLVANIACARGAINDGRVLRGLALQNID